jgi:thiamine-monophosphate kinase
MGEFDLIARYFQRPVRRSPLGVGDDCALLQPQPGMQLAVSMDMLVEGRHFFAGTDARRLGHKALAVNLSDLAACGARPLAFTLALALPAADAAWLAPFAEGLLALADAHGCELVGGDTTRGPLNICITVFGEVPAGAALLRGGARPGDDVWVTGSLGDARLALEALRGEIALPQQVLDLARERLEAPTPRVAMGQALRGIAHAAIDVSDGLLGDLGHVLAQSGVGARIEADAAAALLAAGFDGLDAERRLRCALAGGDDYELAFTAAAARRAEVEAAAHGCGTRATRIGRIEAEPGLRIVDTQGRPLPAGRYASFDHFA